MSDSPIARVASLVVTVFWFAAASASYAQTQTPTPALTPENSSPAAAAQRQAVQPLNNAPIWREVRSGTPQVTTVRGRETNILIQPEGETWRALRVPVVFWGGVLFALTVAGLALLHVWRGTLHVERKPGDRLIERFAPMDRYAHWLVAITWVVLAVTGLILSLGKSVLLPLIGYTLFSWLAILAKNLHNFVGPILIIGTPWLLVRFIRDNGLGRDDIRWFANIKGFFTGHEYPSGRFNGGEKAMFWLMLVLATPVLIVTGLILVFPNFDQTRLTMQISNIVHMVTAYLAIVLACVHIYIGTLGVDGAYRAMRDGYVDESWAKHHHLRWYEEVVAGRARQKFADPNAVPPPATQPRTRPA